MKKLNRKSQSGFTIIEVMIVLAIAGLIMLIVFLAVPALQRSSRNNQRRSDASHLMGLINEYASNHNGQPPTCITGATTNTTGNGSCSGVTTTLDISSETFSVMKVTSGPIGSYSAISTATASNLDIAYPSNNTTCGNNTPGPGGGTRSVAITYFVEPGPILQCVGQ